MLLYLMTILLLDSLVTRYNRRSTHGFIHTLLDVSEAFLCRHHSAMALNTYISPGDEQQACCWPQMRYIISPHLLDLHHHQFNLLQSKVNPQHTYGGAGGRNV
jgi:hypothetical protein